MSQYPIDFGYNIVMPLERSVLSMFQQMLTGLEALKTDIIFFVEHDVLYHPSHFDFRPPRKDIYYFNTNVWMVDSDDGKALYYDGMKKTSGLVAYRDILLEHYREKVALVEREGFVKGMGYEPGRKAARNRPDDYDIECFKSQHPNIDIKHNRTVTRARFRLEQYQHGGRRYKDSWILTDEVPHWGKTKPFGDFLRSL